MSKFFTLFLSLFLLTLTKLNAATKVWVSGANWQTAVWSPAGVPTSADDVTISASTFTIDGIANCGSLKFSSTAATTITVSGTLTINGTTGILTINSMNANKAFNVNVSGTMVVGSTIVYPTVNTSRVTVNAGATLSVNGLMNLQARDFVTVNTNAILNCNGGLIDGRGALTLLSGCNVNIATSYSVASANVTWPVGSNCNIIGNTTITVTTGLVATFSNFTLVSGTATLASPITVAGNWVNNGGTLSAGVNAVTLSGAAKTIGGTTATTFGTLTIASGASCTMNNSNSATSLVFTAAGVNSSLTQAAGVVFTVNGAVTINQPIVNTRTTDWNINNGTATVSGLISFAGANTTTSRIARINIIDGILNANGGMSFTTSAAITKQIVISGVTSGIINLKGALTVPALSSTLTAGTNSTFNYCDAAAAQTVNYFSAGAYNNLTFNNTSVGGATLSAAISAANVTGNLSVQTGTLSNGTFAIVGNVAKIFSVSDGATFKLTGTSVMPTGFGTVSLAVNSTCDFNGTGAQIIAAHNYGNLTSSNTGLRTLVGVGIIGVANVFTPGTNVYTTPGSTIDFNGTGAQTIPAFTYNNLTTSIGGTKTLGGVITVNNDLTINSPTTLDVSASNFAIAVKRNWTNNGTFTYQQGTVSFTGSAAQAIGGTTANAFYNLSVIPGVAGVVVTTNNATNIINDLTFDATAGTLTFVSGGLVTLKSSAGQTARVAPIINPTGLTITGNINIERYAPGGTTGWTHMGAQGISGLTFAQWDDDTYITCAGCPDGYNLGGYNFCSIQSYNEVVNDTMNAPARYIEIASPADAIPVGKGYWVYLGDGASTTNPIMLGVAGSIVKGNLSLPVTCTGGASAEHGWNLLANPYPSPISWDLVRNGNPNVDAEILVYNPDYSAYASYVGGVGTNGLSNTGAIPMGQGFYVHASAATSLNFTESVKSNTQSPLLRLNGNQTPQIASIAQMVYSLKVNGGPYSLQDEAALHFNSNATSAWDMEWDAHKLAGFEPWAPTIATRLNGVDYSINGLPPVNGVFSIPVLTKPGTTGTYSISGVGVNNFPSGACVTLTDLYNGTIHNLKNGPYTCILSDTITHPRFLLTITLNNTLNIVSSSANNTCITNSNGQITAVGNNSGPWNYYWKDATGTVVKTSLNNASSDSLSGLNAGDYTVEISTVGACDYAQQTFTITNPLTPHADFVSSVDTIYITNGTATVNFTNNSLNADSYLWNFGDGTFSVAVSPQQTYTLEGVYEVSLNAYNTGCLDFMNTTKTVVVQSYPLQITSVVNNPSCIKVNEGYIIASGSNSGPWDYTWYDASNAVIKTSLAKNTADSLMNLGAGLYTLRMRTLGSSTDVTETYFIDNPVVPIVNYSASADTLNIDNATNTVTFMNATLNADTYFWDFGDSTYSQLSDPSHTYTIPGTYVISMTAFNANCGDSITAYHFIEVLGSPVGISAVVQSNNHVMIGQDASNTVYVKFDYENNTSSTISFYNVLGAKITNDIDLNAKDEMHTINLDSLKGQLILVEVKSENQSTVVKKIVLR